MFLFTHRIEPGVIVRSISLHEMLFCHEYLGFYDKLSLFLSYNGDLILSYYVNIILLDSSPTSSSS